MAAPPPPEPQPLRLAADVVRWLHSRTFEEINQAWEDLFAATPRELHHELEADLGRQDRWYLLTVLLGRRDAIKRWLYARTREVEAEPDGYLDLWAREHYKSTIITFAGAIQEALKDPEITVGIFSHKAPQAKKFLIQIMVELEVNENLKRLYPEILWEDPEKDAHKWSLDAGLCLKRKTNPKEQTFEAHGLVEGMPTGAHFRLRIYDDVVTEKSVYTPDQIKRTTEAWSLSQALGATQILADGTELPGRAWHIGTRYSFADTYQELMKMGAVKERIYAATDNGLRGGNPVFLAPAVWADKLVKMTPSVLAAQMLQNPAAGNEAMFRIEWMRYIDIRPKTVNVYILGDPANSRKRDSDDTALAVVIVDAARNKILVDGYAHKMNLRERWANLKNLYMRWVKEPGVQGVFVGYERYGMQADLEYFEERMEIEKYHFPIDEVNWPLEGPGSKEDRVERLVPDFMQSKFWLIAAAEKDPQGREVESSNQRRCRDAGEAYRIMQVPKRRDHEGHLYSLNKVFLEQFARFPFVGKKDLIDAVSRIYDMNPVPPIIYEDAQLEPEVFNDGI